ncbi:MAG: site-2 protease family protein [Clostridiales bacterium]|nr:site-2 protease family protein [Clostridiales bacterium]
MLFYLIRATRDPKEILYILVMYILALSIAFACHEFAHAFVALKLGDDTAKHMGRVTLNPLAHIDAKALIPLLLMGFGWGKPVPVDPSRLTKLKSRSISIILVSIAGVTANFILALIAGVLYVLAYGLLPQDFQFLPMITDFLDMCITLNLGLLAFNLLPIPPLDGFRVIYELVPVKFRYTGFFKWYVRYAPLILFGLIIIGAFANMSFFSGAIRIIEWPFQQLILLVMKFVANLL